MKTGFGPSVAYEGYYDVHGPEQVVPVGGVRFVYYRKLAGQKVTYRIANPGAVAFPLESSTDGSDPNWDVIALEGVTEGASEVHAVVGGVTQQVLRVYVLPRRKVAIRCYLVSDDERSTSRTADQLTDLAASLSAIFVPQANIEFFQLQTWGIAFSGSLGKSVNYGGGGAESFAGPPILQVPIAGSTFQQRIIPRAMSGRIHFFFVWEMCSAGDGRGDLHGFTDHRSRCALIRDNTGSLSLSLVAAHETGHALGLIHPAVLSESDRVFNQLFRPEPWPCMQGHYPGCPHWPSFGKSVMISPPPKHGGFLITPDEAIKANDSLRGR